MEARCFFPGGMRTAVPRAAWAAAKARPLKPLSASRSRERGLAAPPEQVPDLRDRQQLGVGAGQRRTGAARDPDLPGQDQVVNQHVNVDEQVFSWQHGRTVSADKGLR
jgi:hypothetical protein